MTIDQQKMDVYVAVVVYESSSDAPTYEPLFEETFMIVKASSLEEAQQKANQHATNHTSSFKNEAGDLIAWKLKHIIDVNQILYDANTDGAEIYARHFHNYQAYSEFEPLLSGKKL